MTAFPSETSAETSNTPSTTMSEASGDAGPSPAIAQPVNAVDFARRAAEDGHQPGSSAGPSAASAPTPGPTGASAMSPPPVPATPGAGGMSTVESPYSGSTSPTAPRTSGRTIRPTLRASGIAVPSPITGEPSTPVAGPSSRKPSISSGSAGGAYANGSAGPTMRTTRQALRPKPAHTASAGGRAPRLKLSLKASLPGRSSRAGQPKTHAYMQGFEDREMDSSDDETGEGMAFEEQIILRLPEGPAASRLKERVRKREVGADGSEEVLMKFKDSRRAMFKVGQDMFSARLVDLPSLIESHKTLDHRRLFKVADISQMLLATHLIRDESEVTQQKGPPADAQTNTSSVDAGTDFNIDDFIYPHGITPPMKWARKRRFRKRVKKRQTTETVEQEVQRLLAEDQKASQTSYELVDVAEVDADLQQEGAGASSSKAAKASNAAERRAAAGGDDDTSVAGTPHPGLDEDDAASQMADDDAEDVEGSMMGDGSVRGEEDGDVDLDLQAELEAALGEDEEDEDDDDEGSVATSRGRSRSRGVGGGASEDEDLWDDVAGGDDPVGDDDDDEPLRRGGAADDDDDAGGDDDDDDDDDDRVRTDQLEAECREIDSLVRRKQQEADATHNVLIKRRQLDALKRLTHERDVKRARLAGLKEERKQRKQEDAEEAARERQNQAAAATSEQRSEQQRERDNLAVAAAEVEMEEEENDAANASKAAALSAANAGGTDETGANGADVSNAKGKGKKSKASAAKTKSSKGRETSQNGSQPRTSVPDQVQLDPTADDAGQVDDGGDGNRGQPGGAQESEADAEGEMDEDAEGEDDDLWS